MWVAVDRERAERSPCFGVTGALRIVLWLLIAAALFGLWRSVIPLVHLLTGELPRESYTIWLVALLALRLGFSAWLVHAAFNGLNGVRSFPRNATMALIALFIVHAGLVALFVIERKDDEIMLRRVLPELTTTLALALAALVYLQISRRVNATYRYRLRKSEAS